MVPKNEKKPPKKDTNEGIPFDEALRRMVNTPPMPKTKKKAVATKKGHRESDK